MLTNSFVPSLLLQTLLPPLTISKSIGFSWIVALDGEKSYINLDRILDRISSVQFSSVAWSCLTLCNPTDGSTPGFPIHHQLRSLFKLMSIELVMPSNHLILIIQNVTSYNNILKMKTFFLFPHCVHCYHNSICLLMTEHGLNNSLKFVKIIIE